MSSCPSSIHMHFLETTTHSFARQTKNLNNNEVACNYHIPTFILKCQKFSMRFLGQLLKHAVEHLDIMCPQVLPNHLGTLWRGDCCHNHCHHVSQELVCESLDLSNFQGQRHFLACGLSHQDWGQRCFSLIPINLLFPLI